MHLINNKKIIIKKVSSDIMKSLYTYKQAITNICVMINVFISTDL